MKEYINKWKHIPCSSIRRLNIVKMSILCKVIYWFIAILTKIPKKFFAEIEKPTLEFRWNFKGPRIVKTFLKKSRVGRLRLADFRTSHKAAVIKQCGAGMNMTQHTSGTGQSAQKWNLHICSQLTFDRGAKTIQWGKDNLFNWWCWENWIFLVVLKERLVFFSALWIPTSKSGFIDVSMLWGLPQLLPIDASSSPQPSPVSSPQPSPVATTRDVFRQPQMVHGGKVTPVKNYCPKFYNVRNYWTILKN